MGFLDQIVVKSLSFVPKPIVARVSRPYIAGDNLGAAVDCVRSLNRQGFRATVDVLGEFITNLDQARDAQLEYKELLDAIEDEGLDASISIKPTSFGLLLDYEVCRDLLIDLMDQVVAQKNFMRIDMEDSPCTGLTIEMYRELRERYGNHIGVVLQAYLRRTIGDIELAANGEKANFRICKGIYVEPEEIAFKGYQEVRDNFVAGLEAMFESGAYVGIATHDDYLVDQAMEIIARRGLKHDRYEFQMLLGVRERLRDKIKKQGHPIRIYVPFGKDWYGYSIRRLKENPALAGTVFKAMFIRG